MSPSSEPAVPGEPASEPVVREMPKRPVSPNWQRDCRRFGAWLAGTSFIAGLAWLTGAHALVPLSNGKVIHASYVGWPFWLKSMGTDSLFHRLIWTMADAMRADLGEPPLKSELNAQISDATFTV